eukprot:7117-Alexandrium_andersonii.AAC.1
MDTYLEKQAITGAHANIVAEKAYANIENLLKANLDERVLAKCAGEPVVSKIFELQLWQSRPGN